MAPVSGAGPVNGRMRGTPNRGASGAVRRRAGRDVAASKRPRRCSATRARVPCVCG